MRTLELLLNRRWILKSRERELYYQVKEEIPDGEARVSGGRESVYDQGRKDACSSGKLDGHFRI